jgi:hypothetical protein
VSSQVFPSSYWPRVVTLGQDVFGVSWLGKLILQYSSRAQAKASTRFLKAWMRRVAKSDAIQSANLTDRLGTFLYDGADPSNGFVPPLNVV